MTIVRLFIIIFLLQPFYANADESDIPLTTDNRIRTYIYNPKEIYSLVLHYGFQSQIKFAKNEQIQTIALGDNYAWNIKSLGNRLFIKPLERNIYTNMVIITNKREYQFDVFSRELDDGIDTNLVYAVDFYYPPKNKN